MDEMTSVIPVIRTTGIEYVNQAAAIHSVTVIVSALNEASHLVSMSGSITDEIEYQKVLHEAEECANVALSYLSQLLKPQNRVQWFSGYSTYQGTIVQTMDDGRYMVVPDGAVVLFVSPGDCQIIQ
jgi:hypothetical protein